MEVRLIDFMGTDLTVVNAARVSFNKHKDTFDLNDKKLIKYLASHNHWTPFAHPQATFYIKAPVFVRTQCFKHKVGFVENEVSRRYVDSQPEFYEPEIWREKAANKKQGSLDTPIDANFFIQKWYQRHLKTTLELYTGMLAEGVAPEQARMVLPQSMYTEWYWTGSLAAFARFCQLRTSEYAQQEIKELACMVSDYCRELWPVSWSVLAGLPELANATTATNDTPGDLQSPDKVAAA